MKHLDGRRQFLQSSLALGGGLLAAGHTSIAALATGDRSENILINGNMTIDDLNEGAEVVCRNDMSIPNTAASRWYVQLISASGGEATVQRVPSERSLSSGVASKITVTKAAPSVVGLDRIQLFQPIVWDELLGYYFGAESNGGELRRTIPMTMRFSIKTNIDLDIGCTLNNGVTTRNWTTSRSVKAGEWSDIELKIEGDTASNWKPATFVLYFQIGLSCGDTRLTTRNGYWNDGHSLMIEQPDTGAFMMTKGATALITDCSLIASDGPERPAPESALQNQSRLLRYEEKSYPAGVRVGAPNAMVDTCRVLARDTVTEDRISFLTRKYTAPAVSSCRIYSPVSGAAGMAYDANTRTDVPVQVDWATASQMGIKIPQSTPSHTYLYHWRATTLV